MALVQFTPKAVPRRYPDRVQLYAVLVPWIGRDARAALSDEGAIIDATLGLVDAWRRRIFALADAGWEVMAGDDPAAIYNRVYAANCRPAFVVTAEETRPCKRRAICPFCWARQVRETWLGVDHAFFADQDAARRGQSDAAARSGPSSYDLIENTLAFEFPQQVRREDGTPAEALPYMVRRLGDVRRRYMRLLLATSGVVGAHETHRVGVTREGLWRVEVRRLVMACRGFVGRPVWWDAPPLGEDFRITTRLRRTETPRRFEVLRAVARVGRYPTSLLRGNVDAVATALGGLAGRKRGEMYGAFRNRAERLRAEPDS